MPMMNRRFRQSFFVVTLAAALLTATMPSRGQQRTVGSGAEQLQINFLALNKADGLPVLDLKPGDITLKVGGRNRVVNALNVMKMEAPQPRPAPVAAAAGAPAAPPFRTNVRAATNGRNVIIVIDNETVRSGEEGPLKKRSPDSSPNFPQATRSASSRCRAEESTSIRRTIARSCWLESTRSEARRRPTRRSTMRPIAHD